MRALAVLLYGVVLTAAAPDLDEGDSAPFMVVVRHGNGRACSGALVSLRTVLSSAACTALAADLWAVAPDAPAAARRVLRVVRAAAPPPAPLAGDPWAGAGSDLALLELAEPLPGAKSILMATEPAECMPPQACHLVRALRREPAAAARLRIVDARLEPPDVCAALGPRWPSLRAHTLCLAGPELCEADRGTGVVCGGKLCGVVSRSAGARCGHVHAAASVARWRRFLHCAHTRGACGRDGDCAALCEERWLVEAPFDKAGTERPTAVSGERRAPPAEPLQLAASTLPEVSPSAAPLPPPLRTESPGQGGAALEFEPNRADFNVSVTRAVSSGEAAAPSARVRWPQTSASARVLLKAGEYDASPDYSAPEEPPPSTPPRAPSRTAPPASSSPCTPAAPRMLVVAARAPRHSGTALVPLLCAASVINIP